MADEHTQNNAASSPEATTDVSANGSTHTESIAGAVPMVTQESTAPAGTAAKKVRNTLIVLVVVLILAVLGYLFFIKDNSPLTDAVGEENLGAVATVNGVDVAREEYDRSLSSISQGATLQGADISDPEVRAQLEDQALNMVINNELLVQAARAAGYVATEEEIDAQYAAVEEQFGGSEALQSRMAEVGITDADLREDIQKQLVVNTYVNTETKLDEVTVTDAEINDFIASLNVDTSEMPPLEEIRPQIETSLITQKQQDIIDAFIASLKETATINIHI